MSTKPTVGRKVHYVSYGTPGGEFPSVCRSAEVTEVDADGNVGLAVLNPTGLFFHPIHGEKPPVAQSEDDHRGGTWHWPCVWTPTTTDPPVSSGGIEGATDV